MLRSQIRFYKIFTHPKVLYSTASAPSAPSEAAKDLLHKLSAEFEDVSLIKTALYNNELSQLIHIHFDEWRSRILVLKTFHFSDTECFKIISKYPSLLKIPVENFTDTTEQWFKSDLRLKTFQRIILNQPELLEVDVSVIRKRIPQLQSWFTGALPRVLMVAPNVMFDDWNLIQKKVNFLTQEKGFKMGDVVESWALIKSLSFIKFRLDLVEKCGIYKQDYTPIHKVNKFDKSKYVNPTLKSILDRQLKNFTAMAKISIEEYHVCKSLFSEEESYEIDENDE